MYLFVEEHLIIPISLKEPTIYTISSEIKLQLWEDTSPKDVMDIVYICEILQFNWEDIFNDAAEKNLWANPINAAQVLEEFPVEKIHEIGWIEIAPTNEWVNFRIKQIITNILDGTDNIPTRT